MQVLKIPKGAGKVRVVYSPGDREQDRLRQLLPSLQEVERRAAAAAGVADVAHGFVRGRSPITAAELHVGYQVTISCDLAGWFDHVSPAQVARGLESGGVSAGKAWSLARRVCCLGVEPSPRAGELAPRQGLSTSPTACNLAAVELDRMIVSRLGDRGVYTRYADDMVISLNGRGCLVDMARLILSDCAAALGWPIAQDKTRIQWASAGRRIVCGVSVGESSIRAPRSARRKLRAARHQNNRPQADGLAQWCAMRSPRSVRRGRRSPWQDMVSSAPMTGAGNGSFAAPAVRRRIIRGSLPEGEAQ